MPWTKDGHYQVSHRRVPWRADTPDVIVHASLTTMNGAKGLERASYVAAKKKFDQSAADAVVRRCLKEAKIEEIVDRIVYGDGLRARLVIPFPDFDDDDCTGNAMTNAIPYAYAAQISEITGLPIDEEIIQSARVGRTKLTRWQRFLFQPEFGGTVRTDQPYILVDDVMSTGGTLAAMRSYIERNNGTVLFATVLANRSAENQQFPISEETLKELNATLGGGFEPFWLETIGHEASCLTEFEGRVLIDWCKDDEQAEKKSRAGPPLLQRLRTHIDAVAAS